MRSIAALPDPVGETIDGHRLENGLDVRRVRVPLGVVAVVYEARPNVTVDCSALCLKSGNAIVLRGSSMAAHSNAVLAQVVSAAAPRPGFPTAAISIVAGGDRDELRQLATQDGLIDLIIPRGGEGLKAALKEHATVPVMYAAAGNCHVFVDATADLDDALRDRDERQGPAPLGVQRRRDAARARRRRGRVPAAGARRAARARASSCAWTAARARWPGDLADSLAEATEEDWSTEYHALILAVKVVDSVDEAIEHVNRYGSGHSEAIVTGSTRVRAGLHRRRRRGLRLRERLHALHRRRRLRHGRRDRQLDPEAARARPDRRCASSRTYKFVVEGSGQVRE